ncbi:MAG: hypothetical protein FD123_207 [Bacteroidetes bacterium]|nr:MAG: hypothetical protein FD123_207 [Bacteroidota bacterium]
MVFLYFILVLILGMIGYFLYIQVKESRQKGLPFWHFGDYTVLAWSLITLTLAYIFFNVVSFAPSFSDTESAIRYGEKTAQPWITSQAFREKLERDPNNIDNHFGWIKAHFTENYETQVADVRTFNREGTAIFNFYTALSENGMTQEDRDMGNLGLGLYYMFRENEQLYVRDYGNARKYLLAVSDTSLKYLNYGLGVCLFYDFGYELAMPHFETELKKNGYKAGAWYYLGWIYFRENQDNELRKLVYNPESRPALDFHMKREYFYRQGDLLSFYQLYFTEYYHTLSFFGLLGAFLVLLIWLFFLHKVGFVAPMKWTHSALAVCIGFITALFAWLIYAFYEYTLDFERNGEILNDALYCFLGIGVIEELIKLIPFLVILRFTNIIQKPIHYILVASFSALGFAFFENLLYISQSGLSVIHARALTACVAHMLSSAVIAYGFVLGRYRYPGKTWLWVPLMFLLSALAHGFYDFWLLNEKVQDWFFVTFFFYLSEILVLASLLNNALNQSVDPGTSEKQLTLNTSRLSSLLSGLLVFVFAVEFISLCLMSGTEYGNKALLSGFMAGGYLIFFLSVRLSNIDIVPGEWAPIEFFAGLLPSDIGSRKLNLNSVVGLDLGLYALNRPGPLQQALPVKGMVRSREKRSGYSGWFIVMLDFPLLFNGTSYPFVFIRAKNKEELINKEEPTVIAFCLPVDPADPNSQMVFVDWAVAK